MKKTLLVTFLVTVLLLTSIPQVFALELKVSQNGVIYFFEDSVLGESDYKDKEEQKDYKETQKREFEKQRENRKDKVENRRENRKDKVEKQRENRRPIRTMSAKNKKIHVETDKDKLRVDLRNKSKNYRDEKTGFERFEGSRVDRLKMEFPAGRTEKQEKLLEQRKNKFEKQRENKKDKMENRRENRKDRIEALRERNKDYFKKLKEERKKRIKELVELRNKQRENGKQELELQSRGVKAKLRNADFNYDPETGLVTLTDANGETHELNHLPDQAVERMKAKFGDIATQTDVEITTNPDGTVEYKAKGKKKTKLFGLISRTVDTQVSLNDTTGEVIETAVKPTTPLARLLNFLSF